MTTSEYSIDFLTHRTTASTVEAGARAAAHVWTVWIDTGIDDLLRAVVTHPAVETDLRSSGRFACEVSAAVVSRSAAAVGSEEVGRTRDEANNILTLVSYRLQ